MFHTWYDLNADIDWVDIIRCGMTKQIYFYGCMNRYQLVKNINDRSHVLNCKLEWYLNDYDDGYLYIKNLEATLVQINFHGNMYKYLGYSIDIELLDLDETCYGDSIMNMNFDDWIDISVNNRTYRIWTIESPYEIIQRSYLDNIINESDNKLYIKIDNNKDLRGGIFNIEIIFKKDPTIMILQLLRNYILLDEEEKVKKQLSKKN